MSDKSEHLVIVTGSSRGLGAALVDQLVAAPGRTVLGIARGQRDGLACEQWSCDLADPLPVAERLRAWLGTFDTKRFASATLINNAGVVGGGAPLGDVPLAKLSMALRAGLEATLLLSAAFLDGTQHWPAQRKLLNISSGLGRRAMAGSAAYCAAKGGMDHLTRAIALEQAAAVNGAKVESMAPGVIDTDMQIELRATDPARFPERERFVQMKESGALVSPADCARRILARLAREDFGREPVTDIREP
ncbi:MAG: SDR family NAD(P)-dependent oxidoreductase [Burkholderiales bacterium]|nr:SDR family NAD(P)-dependent oxidoreductase [Burkholderiales bacterium]